jgi:hypothetical protein
MNKTLPRLAALVTGLTVAFSSAYVLADGDPLQAYTNKVVAFINELTAAALVLLPLVSGLAIVAVAVFRALAKAGGASNLHDHDDRIRQIIGFLVIGESALAMVAIVSYFFK